MEFLPQHNDRHVATRQKKSTKTIKVCEVQQILDKFDRDHPEYAGLDPFKGVNPKQAVSYNKNGEPMNAIEDFWFKFQGSSRSEVKLKPDDQDSASKSHKVCEVQQILDKFDRDHPEYAGLDPFKGVNLKQTVSYSKNGEPMNAIEDFWLQSQGNPTLNPKENVTQKPEQSLDSKPAKVCEVQMVLEKFDRDYPELAKFYVSSTNQIVGYNNAGTPLNAIEDFWLRSQGRAGPVQNQEEDADSSESDLDDSGFENAAEDLSFEE